MAKKRYKKNKNKLSNLVVLVLVALGLYAYDKYVKTSNVNTNPTSEMQIQTEASSSVADASVEVTEPQAEVVTDGSNPYFVERLTGTEVSSTDENGNPLGSAQWGATFLLGDLDVYGRATWGHILVSDAQEPGQNGLAREGKITVDPADWKNYKLNGSWVNDRTHTVGFQFGGVNSDKRVLTTAGAYLNRGTAGSGSNQDNPDSMLYYEQRLDSWLATHPNFKLDLYVQPIYEGTSGVVRQMYMQWIGIDNNNETIEINIGGHSIVDGNGYSYVVLDNVFPDYNIDYQTGQVTQK